jgi:hypothetical protein
MTVAMTSPGEPEQTMVGHFSRSGDVTLVSVSETGKTDSVGGMDYTAVFGKLVDSTRAYRQGDVVVHSNFFKNVLGTSDLDTLITCHLAGETVLHGVRSALLDCGGEAHAGGMNMETAGYMVMGENGDWAAGQGEFRVLIRNGTGAPVLAFMAHVDATRD